MRLLAAAAAGLLLAVLFTACVAPGSSIGHLSIRGSVESTKGEPLPDHLIEFLLPAAYGLGGLDLVFNKPEDFGHQDRWFSAITDQSGTFSYDLGQQVYHVGCWILPPIGCRPKHPPGPFLLIRVLGFPGEQYAVQTHDGKFRILGADGSELDSSEAHITQILATSESGSTEDQRWTVGVITLRFPAE